MQIISLAIIAIVAVSFVPQLEARQYTRKIIDAHGHSFFDQFDFYTAHDQTNGYVNYVSRGYAQSHRLIETNSQGQAVIRVDTHNVAHGRGRSSVKLYSKKHFRTGVIIGSFAHLPHGCGTWPAFWTVHEHGWPWGGEIDIIEGANEQHGNQAALHTGHGCHVHDHHDFSGRMSFGNGQSCFGQRGCGINVFNKGDSYGHGANMAGGVVYATEWTDDHISIWYWPKHSTPENVKSNSPDPSGWGRPFAKFHLDGSCSSTHFKDHQVVFDLTFCGGFAGGTWNRYCRGKGSCINWVKYHPQAFSSAYWVVDFVRVFQ